MMISGRMPRRPRGSRRPARVRSSMSRVILRRMNLKTGMEMRNRALIAVVDGRGGVLNDV